MATGVVAVNGKKKWDGERRAELVYADDGRAIAQMGHKKIGQVEGGLYPVPSEYNGGVRTQDQVVSDDSFQPAIAAKKDALTGGQGCVALPPQSQRVNSDEGHCGALCATGHSGRNRGGPGVSGLFLCPPQAMRIHSDEGKSPSLTAQGKTGGHNTDGLVVVGGAHPAQAMRAHSPDGFAPSLTSQGKRDRTDGIIALREALLCRPLCITEMLRLMHLPDDFDFGEASLGARRSGIGNGFDAAVVAAVIKQVLRI